MYENDSISETLIELLQTKMQEGTWVYLYCSAGCIEVHDRVRARIIPSLSMASTTGGIDFLVSIVCEATREIIFEEKICPERLAGQIPRMARQRGAARAAV